MGYVPNDFFPDQTYSTFNERGFSGGLQGLLGDILTNLVPQRQQVVVEKDCAAGKHIILENEP